MANCVPFGSSRDLLLQLLVSLVSLRTPANALNLGWSHQGPKSVRGRWHTSLISALGTQAGTSLVSLGQPGVQGVFQASRTTLGDPVSIMMMTMTTMLTTTTSARILFLINPSPGHKVGCGHVCVGRSLTERSKRVNKSHVHCRQHHSVG